MESEIKISVLVTFHNQEDDVLRALNSVKAQKTDFTYEIIVGDDHSTDGTVNKVEKWSRDNDFKVQIVVPDIPPNCPPGFRASRNRLELLKHVKGRFFIFLDGDDSFCGIDKLQKQVDILEHVDNQDCVACGHGIQYEYIKGTKGNIDCLPPKEFQEQKMSLKQYWCGTYFHTNTILFRSSLITILPVDLLINNYNDNMITFSALQHGMIYYLPIYDALYTQTGTGIWTGEKVVISQLRNMFLYDLSIIMNKDIIYESDIRFSSTWINVYKLRKSLSQTQYKGYFDEAIQRKMKYSKLWISYNDLNILRKIFLYIKLIQVILRKMIYKLINS